MSLYGEMRLALYAAEGERRGWVYHVSWVRSLVQKAVAAVPERRMMHQQWKWNPQEAQKPG